MLWYFIYRLGQFLACALPRSAGYRLADFASDIQCRISNKDRTIVANNLDAIGLNNLLPTSHYVREVFRNFGRYLVDFFRAQAITKEELIEIAEIEGLSHIDEALKKGKGVIIISAHIGNWELGGLAMAAMGYPISAVVLNHKNRLVNNIFIKIRKRWGIDVIPLGSAVKKSYESLNSNKMLAILGDRDFSNNGIRMTFLGKESMVPKGPAVLSLRTGAPIVPCFVLMRPGGGYTLKFENRLMLEKLSHDLDSNIRLLTQKYVYVIEDYIRRYPTQWLMFRKFWI